MYRVFQMEYLINCSYNVRRIQVFWFLLTTHEQILLWPYIHTCCFDWIIQCVPHTNKFCYCLINHVDRFVEATLYNRYWFSIKPAPELPALPGLGFSTKWPLMVKILTNRSNTTCFEMISQIHVCSIHKTNTYSIVTTTSQEF